MIRAFKAKLKQKHRTMTYPKTEPALPERFVGKPKLAVENVMLAVNV